MYIQVYTVPVHVYSLYMYHNAYVHVVLYIHVHVL